MDSSRAESIDINNRQRKFGLPGWMVNNIERLNFATDFEQYACSPPEQESYLADYAENDPARVVQENSYKTSDIGTTTQTELRSDPGRTRLPQCLPPRSPLIEGLRHDELLFSSPDSTPCATPEPSPMIRRKISVPHIDDTVSTNPGRWFYMGGKLKKGMADCIPPKDNKENKDLLDAVVKHSESIKRSESSEKSRIKLVISNFDLNAVSPNSW